METTTKQRKLAAYRVIDIRTGKTVFSSNSESLCNDVAELKTKRFDRAFKTKAN